MKKIFIATHETSITGAMSYLEEFLLTKEFEILTMAHSLDRTKQKNSFIRIDGKTSNEIIRKKTGVWAYFIDAWLTISLFRKQPFDFFIGANNFDTFCGIVGKMVSKKNKHCKIFYFGSDFSPKRFNDRFFNLVYFAVEIIALKYADLIISNTTRAEAARITLGLDQKKSLVCPNGVTLKNVEFYPKEYPKDNFVYLSSVIEEDQLIPIVEILSGRMKKLTIITSGDFESLKKVCADKNILLETHENKPHDFVINYLQRFDGFGLVPYNDNHPFRYFCSSLKAAEYLACNVPVVISNQTEMTDYIRQNKLGVVYPIYENVRLPQLLEEFGTRDFAERAKQFYNEYNLETIFSDLFNDYAVQGMTSLFNLVTYYGFSH